MLKLAYEVKIFLISFLSVMLLALTGSRLNPVAIAALACSYMTGIRLLWKSASKDKRRIKRKMLLAMRQEKKIQRSIKTRHAA